MLFGHHFAAIAGAGPLVGPVLAAQMGYLPGTMWIIIGVVLAGGVQDYLVLWLSTRRKGPAPSARWPAQDWGRWAVSRPWSGVLVIMVILLAVLALVVVGALAEISPGSCLLALDDHPDRPVHGRLSELPAPRPGVGVSAYRNSSSCSWWSPPAAGWPDESGRGRDSTLTRFTLVVCIIIYGFAASVLPVWLLLAPRDYLSTFMKVGTIVLLAIGILRWPNPSWRHPAVTTFAIDGNGPAFAGTLFPFLFITIACGAVSGFHALICSGTTPKMIEKESQMRMIGYGGMLTESFVAIMALVTAVIIDQHLYFGLNCPARQTGATGDGRANINRPGGFPRSSPADINAASEAVGGRESSMIIAHRRCADPGVRHVEDQQHGVIRRRGPQRRSGTTSRSCSRRCSS